MSGEAEVFEAYELGPDMRTLEWYNITDLDVLYVDPPVEKPSAEELGITGSASQLPNTFGNNWNDLMSFNRRRHLWIYAFQGRRVDEGQGARPDWSWANAWTGATNNGGTTSQTCNDWTTRSSRYRACSTEMDRNYYFCSRGNYQCHYWQSEGFRKLH